MHNNQTAVFFATDLGELHISSVYAEILSDNYGIDSDLIWHSRVTNSINAGDIGTFRKLYQFQRIDILPKSYHRTNGLLSFNLFSIAANIDYREYNILFTFKDTNKKNRALINKLSDSCDVVLIEEGILLYRKDRNHVHNKRFIDIFKPGFYDPKPINEALGMHPDVDYLLCNWPSLLIENRPEVKRNVEMILTMSTKKIHSKYFTNKLINEIEASGDFNDRSIDVLYIGQPRDNEIEKISSIFKMLPKSKNMTIKPHPRKTNKDIGYDMLNKSRIEINDFGSLPVEMIYALLDYPMVITTRSTVGMRLNKLHPSPCIIYLYNLYSGNEHMQNLVKRINTSPNLFIPDDFSELERILSNEMNYKLKYDKEYLEKDNIRSLAEIEQIVDR